MTGYSGEGASATTKKVDERRWSGVAYNEEMKVWMRTGNRKPMAPTLPPKHPTPTATTATTRQPDGPTARRPVTPRAPCRRVLVANGVPSPLRPKM